MLPRMPVPRCLVVITLVALLGTPGMTRAEHEEPAPEPRQQEGQGDEDHDEERESFDPEADYLALADAPLFLPRSYLYWGTPTGPRRQRVELVFALEYALHLSIYNDLRDKALNRKQWAGAVTLSFEGDLRMLRLESRPVRMPSYRPNLSGQLFYIWHRAQPIVLSLRSGIFHYSNGQEQCTFDERVGDDEEVCRAITDAVQDAELSLNRRNGNFSTNGWLLEAFGRINQVNSKGVAIGQLTAGVSVAGNIRKGPGAMEPALARLYGWGRLSATVEAKKRFGWASMTVRATGTFYPDSDGRTPAAAGSAEVLLGPYWLTGLGFFGRYYGGRDFYNAFFVDNVQQLAAGLAWDGERPLKFKRD